ncbi:ureidoglycolate dehydrogenase [Peribacillus cavernae]|uniref:Ureidoglycolate dehydrogenase n=1 Tax=Peribacillus cavernae TaxID=1674310 RepID=A0A3S0W6Y1_9BACI|nr:ureidoglycolate dehydrogenase [Peribacillus cavernae]MDQ0221159.1 ureidoglycolate dehydrogenase (NAD+) [Peribacillus cavernae]RUQ29087.1 ureidoglycolate dehydrogenase [Peribacillus cavernae]
MNVTKEKLKDLIRTKLHNAGLSVEHADGVADVLVYADARGIHSHGAIRVEYYSERIAKGGINVNPDFSFEKTGPSAGLFNGDNGSGHVAAKKAMDEAIKMAKETGIAVVGVKRISHSGALSYFVQQAARVEMIGLSVCQADPMAVPFGGAEPYYGTNPIAFAAPGKDQKMITFDMATTVKAWGKVLDARSKNEPIPDNWAVDQHGEPTADPFQVNGLLPIAGAKGYGLAMMVDILSGILLGLPFGNRVSPLYGDLSKGRDLGQLHIVINPAFFTDLETFKQNISQTMADLNNITPAPGFEQVSYPGQGSALREIESEQNGIEIVDDVYNYLISDVIHSNKYGNKDPFAK